MLLTSVTVIDEPYTDKLSLNVGELSVCAAPILTVPLFASACPSVPCQPMVMLVNPSESAFRSDSVKSSVVCGLVPFGGLPTSIDKPLEAAADVSVSLPLPVTVPLPPKKSISLASIVMSPVPVITLPLKITCEAPRTISWPFVVSTDPLKVTTPVALITKSPSILTSW